RRPRAPDRRSQCSASDPHPTRPNPQTCQVRLSPVHLAFPETPWDSSSPPATPASASARPAPTIPSLHAIRFPAPRRWPPHRLPPSSARPLFASARPHPVIAQTISLVTQIPPATQICPSPQRCPSTSARSTSARTSANPPWPRAPAPTEKHL